ncbi:MAG: pilus assembly protein CpaF [Actinomycetota bacterium]|nr:pilus assembly protein CpaF [Actinomycetota bacterium]
MKLSERLGAVESEDAAEATKAAKAAKAATNPVRPRATPAPEAAPEPAERPTRPTRPTPAGPTPRSERHEPAPKDGAPPAERSTRKRSNVGWEVTKKRVRDLVLADLGPRLTGSKRVGPELDKEVKAALDRALQREDVRISPVERSKFVAEVLSDILGYGPLDAPLADPTVTEIMCNAYNQIWVERRGVIEPTDLAFTDDGQYRQVIDKIVTAVGRRVDESSPMVDARLPDGSRVNAVVPPLALNGAVLTIRKFAEDPYTVADLINFGSMTMDLALFLEAAVRGKLNVLVSGGTGTGKTTTLNVLSSFSPERERIVTIEDAAELQLQQPHVVRLESRPANSEGKGEVRIRDLVRNALRMRPDRIVVGEVRGGEALDMLQAMNTGHAGSITTVHANTARDALSRLETMVLMAGFDLPMRAIREQIASAINVIVQLERASDGTRRIISVEEVQGLEGDIILLQQLFRFVPRTSVDGRQVGEIEAAGLRPKFLDALVHSGVDLPASVFQAPVRAREVRPKTRSVPSVAELIARSGGPVPGARR